jgi:hypothetical protein
VYAEDRWSERETFIELDVDGGDRWLSVPDAPVHGATQQHAVIGETQSSQTLPQASADEGDVSRQLTGHDQA